MNSKELIQKYLDFFKSKGHAIIKSASLIPENDPTVLFTTAGMHPLVPFLTGQPHALGKRLANVQKCIRTQDIDEVGDETHTTFFEMLGNWSLGDYFKKEAIEWSWEFLTDKKWLGLNPKRLSVSCFAGDKDAPKDEEAAGVWAKLGVPKERIAFLPKKDNWWGPAGETGPCGPDTEMFYWKKNDISAPEIFDPEDKNWVEIWNDVFMQYSKTKEGKYELMSEKNVDTGLGVERVAMILDGYEDIYQTELFKPIMDKIAEISGKKPGKENIKSFRIITDHVRAATFILGDDKAIVPSNVEQGYILRRFIRRAIRHGHILGINNEFLSELAKIVVDVYKGRYGELERNKKFIFDELKKEDEKFRETLTKGLKEFERKIEGKKVLDGKDAFLLFQSFGFPIEMTRELAQEKGISVDEKGYKEAYEKHQELSRVGAEKRFKSGLSDSSVETTKLHTATHMLNEALKIVLNKPDLHQKGSNITPERLRFDFNFDRKLTDEELKKTEDLVKEKIKEEIPVVREELTVEEAKKAGAKGVFESKYGETVSVYTIGNFSKEICAGPHVQNTKELGHFKIVKEESVAAGVRRIKAVLE
ncbi:alanine--tRNA ligase [Candidatus Woesearchaeota archaeon]|nr:alanine--tRNA ligase [Candidatus Woesearchaeota archaeon]